mmetsp:Transcript_9894/g.27707  ORF Transcript_9894/g.27707 Transcript_9894/m.27707 type:complete len:228 (-) Transcript_9894:27-710(-)
MHTLFNIAIQIPPLLHPLVEFRAFIPPQHRLEAVDEPNRHSTLRDPVHHKGRHEAKFDIIVRYLAEKDAVAGKELNVEGLLKINPNARFAFRWDGAVWRLDYGGSQNQHCVVVGKMISAPLNNGISGRHRAEFTKVELLMNYLPELGRRSQHLTAFNDVARRPQRKQIRFQKQTAYPYKTRRINALQYGMRLDRMDRTSLLVTIVHRDAALCLGLFDQMPRIITSQI